MSNPAFECNLKFFHRQLQPEKPAPIGNYSNEILLLNKDRELIGLGYYNFYAGNYVLLSGSQAYEVEYWGYFPQPVPLPEVYIVVFAESGEPAEWVSHGSSRGPSTPVTYNVKASAESKAMELDGRGSNIPGTRIVKGLTNGEYVFSGRSTYIYRRQ